MVEGGTLDNHGTDVVEFGPRTHVLVTGGAGFSGRRWSISCLRAIAA